MVLNGDVHRAYLLAARAVQNKAADMTRMNGHE